MHGNPLQVAAFLAYFFLIPGLPLAVISARRTSNWPLVLALSPLFSIGGNYVTLSLLNLFGIRPDLTLFAGVVTVLCLAGLVGLVQPTIREFRQILLSVLHVLPGSALGTFLWIRAYQGYAFVAANQDAVNHNKWIARVLVTHSALPRDSYVSSPLQKLGAGTGFYPMAWHSAVAVGSSVSDLLVPEASLLSVIALWVFVLPFGLLALAHILSKEIVFAGAIAGLLVQMYALAPGVPMSWGSMTSVAGIALLPSSLAVGVLTVKYGGRFWTLLFIGTITVLFFVHTPEAATLIVMIVGAVLAGSFPVGKKILMFAVVACLAFGIPLLIIFRSTIFGGWSDFESLYGAVQPNWDLAFERFFRLNVNVVVTSSTLAALFIYGLVQTLQSKEQRWIVSGVLATLVIYLISGAPNGILNDLRFLTTPWYASYERTLWVVVPFAALISAMPIAKLFENSQKLSRSKSFVPLSAGVLILILVMTTQIKPTLNQIRSAPERTAMLGPRDVEVMRESRQYIKDDEIALSWAGDGSAYPFSYFQILLTSGQTLDRTGEINPQIVSIYSSIADLCGNPIALDAMTSNKIAVVYFSTTSAWGGLIWTESEVRRLRGLRVVGAGEKIIVTVPDRSTCL